MAASKPLERGLLITPLRQYVTMNAAHSQNGSITVANLTTKTIAVTLTAQQFSVEDYSYTYRFRPANSGWLVLSQTQVQLTPQQSKQIDYQLRLPANTPPGGQYFDVVATSDLGKPSLNSRVQATSLVYVTIRGKLNESSDLLHAGLPWVSFGDALPFSLTVQNTGNVHYFLYSSGRLHGLSVRPADTEVAHLLMPATVRTIGGDIDPPLLPGVYRATYGYRTDGGDVVEVSHYILFLPPWALALPLGAIWIVYLLRRRKARQKD